MENNSSNDLVREDGYYQRNYSYRPLLSLQLLLLLAIFAFIAVLSYRDGTTGAVLTETFLKQKNWIEKSFFITAAIFALTIFFQSRNMEKTSLVRTSMILFLISILILLFIPPVEGGIIFYALALLMVIVGLIFLIINFFLKGVDQPQKLMIKFSFIWTIILIIIFSYLIKVAEVYFRDLGEKKWRIPLMKKQSQDNEAAYKMLDNAYNLFIQGKTQEAKNVCLELKEKSYDISTVNENYTELMKKQHVCDNLINSKGMPLNY